MIWIVSSRRRIYWRGLIQLLTGGRTWDRRRGATWPETDYIYFYTAQNYYSYAPGLEKGYSLSWSGPSSVHPGTHGSRFETEHHSLFTCNTFTVNKPHMNIFVLSSFHSITQVRAVSTIVGAPDSVSLHLSTKFPSSFELLLLWSLGMLTHCNILKPVTWRDT